MVVMQQEVSKKKKIHVFQHTLREKILMSIFVGVAIVGGYVLFSKNDGSIQVPPNKVASVAVKIPPPSVPVIPPLDTAAYDAKLLQLANIPPPKVPDPHAKPVTPGKKPIVVKPNLWPVKTVYPNAGALLPFNRIVAFYGNFYSKGMGILGQYPPDEMLAKLAADVKDWELADPTTPVIPAIHYIVTTAQGRAGVNGTYILRMPPDQIQKALDIAKQANAIVFLDVQLGQSNLQTELPLLEPYLKLPQVHLGLDPEFAMKRGETPGDVVGTLDATDINWAAQYLAKIVRDNNLPPKILIIHRFTQDMLTNSKAITPLPEVQVVINMDGWGSPARKTSTYKQVVYPEPVQFTGFKLFYRNDLRPPSARLMTPSEILKLSPEPIYIQYQ